MVSKDESKCRVCGYTALDELPYDKYGCASFGICPSCGTEFGYDDDINTHLKLRQRWVENGMNWWSMNTKPPSEWNAIDQLRKAGFKDQSECDE